MPSGCGDGCLAGWSCCRFVETALNTGSGGGGGRILTGRKEPTAFATVDAAAVFMGRLASNMCEKLGVCRGFERERLHAV